MLAGCASSSRSTLRSRLWSSSCAALPRSMPSTSLVGTKVWVSCSAMPCTCLHPGASALRQQRRSGAGAGGYELGKEQRMRQHGGRAFSGWKLAACPESKPEPFSTAPRSKQASPTRPAPMRLPILNGGCPPRKGADCRCQGQAPLCLRRLDESHKEGGIHCPLPAALQPQRQAQLCTRSL